VTVKITPDRFASIRRAANRAVRKDDLMYVVIGRENCSTSNSIKGTRIFVFGMPMCRCIFTVDVDGVARDYDGHSERAFTSSLTLCTICLARRMSLSLRPTPRVDAIARKRAFKSL
jgi:hypothetical protein